MRSRARILGHSIHQMLIVFPLGLLGMAAIFDAVHMAIDSPRIADAAFWMLVLGVATGLVAAVFGFIDWLAIPQHTRARRIGAAHGGVMVAAVAAFAASALLRWDSPAQPPIEAAAFSFAGLALALLGGWLGGELVTRLSVGVDEGAHLDAPNSITHPVAAPLAPLGPMSPVEHSARSPGNAEP